MAKRRSSMQAAAAELVAAVAEQSATDEVLDDSAEEITADVLDGLRRLDQGGNRVTWYVYCDSPVEREGFVEKLRTEQLDEQRFKGKYGPGEYRVIGKQSDGQYVKGSHKTIKISSILAEDSRASGGSNDAVTLLREMRAADEKRAAQRADELKTYATILATPLATLGAALIARRPAIDVAALITALRPQQSSLAEMTTALVNLKGMQAEGGAGGGVEIVLKVLERLQDLPQTSGGGELGWLGFIRDIVKEAAPHAREFLGQLKAPGTAGGLPPGATSGPAFGPGVAAAALPHTNGATAPPSVSALSAPSSPVPPSTGENDMLVAIEPWLRRRALDVQEWATNNMDTELCAEMLLASVPKTFRAFISNEELVSLLASADWWQRVTTFHPALTPYQAWVDDLRFELIGLVSEEGKDESAPAPASTERTQ